MEWVSMIRPSCRNVSGRGASRQSNKSDVYWVVKLMRACVQGRGVWSGAVIGEQGQQGVSEALRCDANECGFRGDDDEMDSNKMRWWIYANGCD